MLHYNPLHVSSINMPILRRTNCIITASGIVTLCKRLCSMSDESRLQSQICFRIKLYMFRAVPLPIIRSLFTVHSALMYVIQVLRQLSSSTRMKLPGPEDSFRAGPWSSVLVLLEIYLQTCMTYTSVECTVNKLLMMGRGTARNM
jgi:hypothetical protein